VIFLSKKKKKKGKFCHLVGWQNLSKKIEFIFLKVDTYL
jgi:hypothetical protein